MGSLVSVIGIMIEVVFWFWKVLVEIYIFILGLDVVLVWLKVVNEFMVGFFNVFFLLEEEENIEVKY